MTPHTDGSSTLLPEELLTSKFYFRSPILTLLESLEDLYQEHISLNDISQAYDVLCCRIRQVAELFGTPCDPFPPALVYLQDHSSSLALCLRRDISYAFTRSSSESPPSDVLIPDSVPRQRREPQEEELKYVEDSSELCQFCLELLCMLLKLPVLSGLFTAEDLSYLLHETIRIATTLSLPIPNAQKMRRLAILAISEQRLPVSLVKGQKQQLLSMLNRIFFHREDSTENVRTVNDAFHIIHGLVSGQPLLFLEPLHQFLDIVLQHLLSSQRTIRNAAAHALAGYSRAVIACSERLSPLLLTKIEESICAFTESQLSSRKSKLGAPPPSPTLRLFFTDIISASVAVRRLSDACWAYSVLASCIVLSNGKIFCRPRMIRTVTLWMHDIQEAFGKEVSSIHLGVWKCFIWSLSRLCRHVDHQAKSVTGRADSTTDGLSKIWDGATRFVQQDLELQNGIALVTLLMNSSSLHKDDQGPFIGEIMDVLKTMVGHENVLVYNEAVALFACLTVNSDDRPLSPWTNDHIIPQAVFDGTMLYQNERLHTLYSFDIDPGHIPRIPQDEIPQHWDVFLTIWTIATRRLALSGTYPAANTDLLRIWHELLIAQSQLTQGHGHLAVSPDIIQDIVKVISKFLEAPEKLSQGVAIEQVQLAQLKTVFHLWIVTKFAVGPSNEGDTAAAILGTLLGFQFLLNHVEVKAAWSELCSELMIAQDPLLLSSLQERSDSQNERELRQHLWKTVTVQYIETKSDDDNNWERKLRLLLIPLANHNMPPDERELWVKLLNYALEDAQALFIAPSVVLQTIVENASSASLAIPVSLTFTLLSHLQLKPEHTLPLSLLNHINNSLLALYPPQADTLLDALQLFSSLADLLTDAPQCHLINIIVQLSTSLIVWFHNDSGNFDDSVFNDHIIPLYCTALQRLETTPLTVSILHDLTSFLTSPFNYIPIPGIAPRAFKKFWENAVSHVDSLETNCPPDLQDFLDAWGTMCDEHQSQSQESQMSFSSVPDSQPPMSQEDPEYTYLLSLSSGRDEDSSSRASGSQPKTPSKWSVSQRTDSSSLLNFSRLTLPQGAQPAPARSDLSTSIMSNTKARQKDDASFTEDSWPSVPGLSSSSDNLGLISSLLTGKKRLRDDDEPASNLASGRSPAHDSASPMGDHGLSQDNLRKKRARSTSDSASPAATPTRKTSSRNRHECEHGLSQDVYDSWEMGVPSPEVQCIRQELTSDVSHDHVMPLTVRHSDNVSDWTRRSGNSSPNSHEFKGLDALRQAQLVLQEAGSKISRDEAEKAWRLLDEIKTMLHQRLSDSSH